MPENSLKLTSTNYSIRFIVALGTSTCSVTEGIFTLRKGKVSYDTELGSVEQETLPLSALTVVCKASWIKRKCMSCPQPGQKNVRNNEISIKRGSVRLYFRHSWTGELLVPCPGSRVMISHKRAKWCSSNIGFTTAIEYGETAHYSTQLIIKCLY